MKKIFFLVFMLMAFAKVFATVEVEIEGLWYELTSSTNEAEVIQYKNNSFYNGNIIIPETVEYEGISYSVTHIGYKAFYMCGGLINITIPNSVTRIDDYAFQLCTNLTSITIPNSVSSIGVCVFNGCSGLISAVISNRVTCIDSWTFNGCSSLTFINIPNSVESIGEKAFEGCSSLYLLNIPNSVTDIGASAFQDCTSLSFVSIPNSVKTISGAAFRNCNNLTRVSIGNSVNTIYYGAFSKCKELTDVYCYSQTVPSALKGIYVHFSGIFDDSPVNSATLHVPSAQIDAYSAATEWNVFENIVDFDVSKHFLTYVVDGKVYKTFEVSEGTSVVPETKPTKEGYTFSGWSEIPETMPANDVIITGTFSINKYKLVYTVDGEEYKSYEVEYGAAITAEAAPTKEGYTFSGWNDIPETMPANDVIVTGTFSVNKYKLTYMLDGAEYKSYDVEYGASITPEPKPEGDYDTFEWKDLPQTMPAHDVVVYASYTTDIGVIITSDCQNSKMFSIDGKPLNEPQKGLNIIHMDNGKTKKVVVK